MSTITRGSPASATAGSGVTPLNHHHAPRLGIIGAGQLARMTAMAAAQLGCEVVVLASNPDEPACALATHCVLGDRDDPAALAELAAAVDVVTLENEFVDARSLETLERRGVTLFPSAHCIACSLPTALPWPPFAPSEMPQKSRPPALSSGGPWS